MVEELLDNRDMQILSILDKNSRMSVSQIAKKINLSKDGVKYRLANLEKRKIITRYFADIDVSKIGLILNKIVFKFQNLTKSREDEIFSFLSNHPKIGWVVFCSGAWDAMVVAYTQDLYEYHELVKQINEKYGKYIHTKEFVAHPDYYVCNRKWLSDRSSTVSHIGGPVGEIKLDETDLIILRELARDSRVSVLYIAEKTKLSSSAVIKRIRVLEEKKIILNYRIGINLEKIGKEFCKSFIYLQNTNREIERKIIDYCLAHKNVTAVTNSLGSWDFELEMEVNNFDEFYTIMNEIRSEFSSYIKNYDAVAITKEYGINYETIIRLP